MKRDISLFREHFRRVGIEEVIEAAREVLRRGYIDCIDPGAVGEREERLVTVLYLLGCRYVCLCEGGERSECSLEELGFYEDISPQPYRVFEDTEELLYRNWPTPLVRLRTLSGRGTGVWAKLEFYNPFSMSIKDRIGWYMVKRFLEESREAPRERVFYEATSTNTGVAIASMAALTGYRARLYLPSTIQRASDTILRVVGAEVYRRGERLTIEYIDEVDETARRHGGVHLNQFYNDNNFLVHLRFTAKELDLQIRSRGLRPRGLVAGIGTSGHFSALSLYLKSRYGDQVKTYAVQPAPGDTIPGIRRVETGMKWIHMVPRDGLIDVGLEEAVREAIEIARREGLFIGLSSGAVVAGFKRLYREGLIEEGDYILVFPDHGFKYIEQFSRYLEKTTPREDST